MSKKNSNRNARRILLMPFWFSNRKQMSGWPSTLRPYFAPDKGIKSRSQRRAARVNQLIREELRIQRELQEQTGSELWESVSSINESEKQQ